ncbi:MAG: zinc ABC transporter substrate-binding protein [Bacteroidetes bacterium]|nr:zinc ABC transporter substrate-binding protein [Bacteroidota bacterium]
MKNSILLLLFLVIAYSCSNTQKQDDGNLNLVVSILPQKYFLEKIAGDKAVDITVMIPPGVSPAIYDPTPKQIAKLSDADIYFMIGHIGYENAWISELKKNNPELKFINVSEGIPLIHGGHSHGEEDHEEHGVDPHTWMSPRNVMIIAQNIYKSLVEQDPDNQLYYAGNYNSFLKELKVLDSTYQADLNSLPGRTFFIYHPALTYFARDYGLEQVSVEKEGKEPSVKYMADIVSLAREKNIKIIFVQREFDTEHAATVAEEAGAGLVVIDPLAEDWNEGINHIVSELKNALSQ